MPDIPAQFHRHWLRITIVAAVLALVLGGGWWSRQKKENPLLATPQLALESLTAKSLYFNAAARPWLLSRRPELLTPEDRDARSERSRTFAQAVTSPTLFRQLDRKYRFDTLFFVGDPSQYHTLLDHLVETKDFALTHVDHTSMVFSRSGAAAWSLSSLDPVRARLAGVSKGERAEFLALTAAKLNAAHRQAEAKTLLDEALALDAHCAEAWSALASFEVNSGNWNEALTAADRALNIDANHLNALATKAQVFYATKRYDAALALSQRLIASLPDDPNVLFKHAQIAHEAHAFKTEIAALEKVVALAETDQRSTTGYRLYLAQAYTAAGDGPRALENFNRVLTDPDLPDDQRKFANESIERIKKRTGL